MGFYIRGHGGQRPHTGQLLFHERIKNCPLPIRAEGRECIRQGTTCDLLRGCTDNGVRDQTIPAMRCAGLPTQQQATHHPAIHGYESLPDLWQVPPIRIRSIWEGCSPWFRSIRSDGSRGLMLDCRVP